MDGESNRLQCNNTIVQCNHNIVQWNSFGFCKLIRSIRKGTVAPAVVHKLGLGILPSSTSAKSKQYDDRNISHFQKTFFVQFEVNDSAQKRERIRKYCSCWRGVCGAWRSWAHSRLDGAMLVTGCWVKEEGIAEIIGNQVKWGDCCVFGTFLLAPKWLNQTSRYFWGRHYIYFTISVFYDVRTFP